MFSTVTKKLYEGYSPKEVAAMLSNPTWLRENIVLPALSNLFTKSNKALSLQEAQDVFSALEENTVLAYLKTLSDGEYQSLVAQINFGG